MSKWEKEDETPYLVSIPSIYNQFVTHILQVQVHEQDKVREDGFNSSAPSSIHDSDDSSEGSVSEGEGDSIPASQEEVAEDLEGVMPEAIEEGHSPVDDMKGFDWGEIDEELASFMGSDDDESDNESGAESVASDVSIRSRTSHKIIPQKRKVGDTTDENSGDESTLAKKQRIANSRTTGLKTVKTPNSMQSESSLPTPGPTGDEDGEEDAVDQIPTGDDEDDNDDDPFGDDLEADLMAEFEREEEESKGGDGG